MKILYVAKKYEYGNPQNGLSYLHHNFYDTLKKMDNGRHEIVYFPLDEVSAQASGEELNEKLARASKEENPDLIFFIISMSDATILSKEILLELKEKTPTLNFFTDDYWQFDRFSRHWAPYFTWVATSDPDAPVKYRKIGYQNVVELQYACNHFLYTPLSLPKEYDVTFIGTAHGNRKKMAANIEKAGVRVTCWGSGWPNGRVSWEEMRKIFCQSKINLNFSNNSGVLSKELFYLFFHRTRNRSIHLNDPRDFSHFLRSFRASMWGRAIHGRVFEVLGCNSFLLAEYAPHIEKYYEIDKEIVCFQTVDELAEKVTYYAVHEKEREKIAKAGYLRTIQDHTYEQRFKTMFQSLGLSG